MIKNQGLNKAARIVPGTSKWEPTLLLMIFLQLKNVFFFFLHFNDSEIGTCLKVHGSINVVVISLSLSFFQKAVLLINCVFYPPIVFKYPPSTRRVARCLHTSHLIGFVFPSNTRRYFFLFEDENFKLKEKKYLSKVTWLLSCKDKTQTQVSLTPESIFSLYYTLLHHPV